MLSWIFGLVKNDIHVHSHDRAAGYLEFKRPELDGLSINSNLLPQHIKEKNQTTYRSIKLNLKNLNLALDLMIYTPRSIRKFYRPKV